MEMIYQLVTSKGSVLASYRQEEHAQKAKDFYNKDSITIECVEDSCHRKPSPQEKITFDHYVKMQKNLLAGLPWWNQS